LNMVGALDTPTSGKEPSEEDITAARNGLEKMSSILKSGSYDVVVANGVIEMTIRQSLKDLII